MAMRRTWMMQRARGTYNPQYKRGVKSYLRKRSTWAKRTYKRRVTGSRRIPMRMRGRRAAAKHQRMPFKPRRVIGTARSRLVCLNIQATGALQLNPQSTDAVFINSGTTTTGLDPQEYDRVQRICQDYDKVRFVGMSFGLKRTGDQVIATSTAGISIMNKVYSRMRSINDAYTDFAQVDNNPVSFDSLPNVTSLGSYQYGKLYKFTIPESTANTRFTTPATLFPLRDTTFVPALLLNRSIGQLITSNGMATGAAQTIANNIKLCIDMFPQNPAVSSVAYQQTTSFTLMKKFYFELQGPRASGINPA